MIALMTKNTRLPTVAEVRQLPELAKRVVPPEWEDYNGHVNVCHYMSLYEDAGWPMFAQLGIDAEYFSERRLGIFDFSHFIRYLNEIHVGDEVSLYCRFLTHNAKRLTGMTFVVNNSRDNLASTLEFLSSGADLQARRTAEFPPDVLARLEATVRESDQLPWDAPLCGAISV